MRVLELKSLFLLRIGVFILKRKKGRRAIGMFQQDKALGLGGQGVLGPMALRSWEEKQDRIEGYRCIGIDDELVEKGRCLDRGSTCLVKARSGFPKIAIHLRK